MPELRRYAIRSNSIPGGDGHAIGSMTTFSLDHILGVRNEFGRNNIEHIGLTDMYERPVHIVRYGSAYNTCT